MGIDYNGRLVHHEWTDGLQFYEEIKAWAQDHEAQYMIPALSNKQTADELVPLLLFYVPKQFKRPAANLVGVLMGDRLRSSMMYVSSFYVELCSDILAILPRPKATFNLPRRFSGYGASFCVI